MDEDGRDINHGVVKHWNGAIARNRCLAWCLNYRGATGCEHIVNQGNKGCYVFTTADVDHGNNAGNHECWIFDPADGAVQSPPLVPVPDGSTCEDDTRWKTIYGEGCGAVADNPDAQGSWIDAKGLVTAAEACCFFGGGVWSDGASSKLVCPPSAYPVRGQAPAGEVAQNNSLNKQWCQCPTPTKCKSSLGTADVHDNCFDDATGFDFSTCPTCTCIATSRKLVDILEPSTWSTWREGELAVIRWVGYPHDARSVGFILGKDGEAVLTCSAKDLASNQNNRCILDKEGVAPGRLTIRLPKDLKAGDDYALSLYEDAEHVSVDSNTAVTRANFRIMKSGKWCPPGR